MSGTHPKRKAVVVSMSPAKPASIRQPARSSGSVIDLSTPDAALAVASASPTKPVCIGQPACSSGSVIDMSAPDAVMAVASVAPAKPVCIPQQPRSSGSVIDLSAPDVALAVASTSPMKPTFGHSSGIVIVIARIDAGDLGCRCREHRVCCSKVVRVDMVVKWPLWDLWMSMFWMDAEIDGCEDRANGVLLVMEPFMEVGGIEE